MFFRFVYLAFRKRKFWFGRFRSYGTWCSVISTNTGGLPEVNINGESGYLSDVGDVDDMANNALKIFKDPKTHQKFKDAAKKRARAFDIKNVIQSYENLYKTMLSEVLINITIFNF